MRRRRWERRWLDPHECAWNAYFIARYSDDAPGNIDSTRNVHARWARDPDAHSAGSVESNASRK